MAVDTDQGWTQEDWFNDLYGIPLRGSIRQCSECGAKWMKLIGRIATVEEHESGIGSFSVFIAMYECRKCGNQEDWIED